MTTIRPNTLRKDKLVKQENSKIAKRAVEIRALHNLLASVSRFDPLVISSAVAALMDAADSYRASIPILDSKGRGSRPSISEGRASLTALHKSLTKTGDQLSSLPLDAISALGVATGVPADALKCLSIAGIDADDDGNFSTAIGKLSFDIDQARQAVELAIKELAGRPHRAVDAARIALAYDVAVVFINILKKKPSSTRAKQLKENKSRGGAAYDRVLRATLKAAGVTNYDSGPLIAAGLRLLRDTDLPSRT